MAKKKLLIAAAIVGLFAAGLVYLAIDQQSDKVDKYTDPAHTRTIVKAKRNIPKGTPLEKDHLTRDTVPKQFLPRNVILKNEVVNYLGQPLSREIKEGKMITTSDFDTREVANNLAAKVPKKERAMSMPVDKISGVSGLLRPGDRVDIIGTFPVGSEDQVIPESGGGSSVGYVTMTLLQNVTLLAVGKRISSVSGKGKSNNYSTVTMSVTVEEAELLTIAQTRGDMNLLLRNPEDVKIDRIKRKSLKQVLKNLELINKERQKRQKKRPVVRPKKEDKDEGPVIIRGDK